MNRVLCVGIAKTGTTSFKAATETLGFTKAQGYYRDGTWSVISGDLRLLDPVADNCRSFSDAPWYDPVVVDRFLQRHPETLVVLTRRKDAETWAASMENWCKSTRSEWRKYFYGYHQFQECPKAYIETYLSHLEEMRRVAGLEVCFEEGDGWEPLCEYLKVPIPDLPFPHKNKQVYHG